MPGTYAPELKYARASHPVCCFGGFGVSYGLERPPSLNTCMDHNGLLKSKWPADVPTGPERDDKEETLENQMPKHTQARPVPVLITRWIARVLSVLSIGIILLFFIGEADFSAPINISAREWIGLLFFPVGIIVGMVLAWRWEGLGTAITVGSLVTFYVSHFTMWGSFPRGPFFTMFASPGLVFGASWLLSRKMNTPESTGRRATG